MFLKFIAIFFLTILWGSSAMGVETSFNQNVREAFKKSIGYPSLLAHPPAEKLVVVDWKKILSSVTDADGHHWVGSTDEPSLGSTSEGSLNANLKSANGMALIKITSLSGSWKQRLDHVMWVESLTNMGEIACQVKTGVADLYLVPKYSSGTPSVSFLYGNFYVEVSHWEHHDIGALALKLLKIMEDHSRPPLVGNNSPKFTLTVDKNNLAVGDTFSITVKGGANWGPEWIYAQTEDLLPEYIVQIDHERDVFTFKALAKGVLKIDFTAMNTRTLLLSVETIGVTIK